MKISKLTLRRLKNYQHKDHNYEEVALSFTNTPINYHPIMKDIHSNKQFSFGHNGKSVKKVISNIKSDKIKQDSKSFVKNYKQKDHLKCDQCFSRKLTSSIELNGSDVNNGFFNRIETYYYQCSSMHTFYTQNCVRKY
jgi:hypothetical protein